MATFEAKDIAAVAGPIIAIASLAYNVYQGRLIRRLRPHVAKVEEVRSALGSLLDVFESRLINIPVMQERWDQGFATLKAGIEKIGSANRIISFAPAEIVPHDTRLAVGRIHADATELYAFQDSFAEFSAGREYMQYNDYQEWPDRQHAERALHQLQTTWNREVSDLRSLYRKLSS